MYRSQTAEGENGVVVLDGAAGQPAPTKKSPAKESKFKSLFKGRRRSGQPSEAATATEPAKKPAPTETNRTGSITDANGRSGSRGTALSSHPITGDELVDMQRRRSSVVGTAEEATPSAAKENEGDKRASRLRSSFMKMVSRNQESKPNGYEGPSEAFERSGAQGTSTAGREGLRDSAAEQGLPVPPAVGVGKHTSNATRESRFSEDL